VTIKVLAQLSDESTVPLGSFALGPIPAAPTGTPQLLVLFTLDEHLTLRVSAEDRTPNGSKASIVIRDRLPTPPRERPTSKR
jgi:molecular chaperone DnaK (HSP70)